MKYTLGFSMIEVLVSLLLLSITTFGLIAHQWRIQRLLNNIDDQICLMSNGHNQREKALTSADFRPRAGLVSTDTFNVFNQTTCAGKKFVKQRVDDD
ncbi:MAG: hypothetical protein ACOVQX_01070 [Legionella sp.]